VTCCAAVHTGGSCRFLIVGGTLNGMATEQGWIGRNARKIDAPPSKISGYATVS